MVHQSCDAFMYLSKDLGTKLPFPVDYFLQKSLIDFKFDSMST